MQPPGSIEDQGKAGNGFDKGQTNRKDREDCLRDEIVIRNGCGECPGIEEFGNAAINEQTG